MAKDQYQAAINAIISKGRLHGLIDDKNAKKTNVQININTLSDEELRQLASAT